MIRLEEISAKEYYCGITVDHTFKIMNDEQHIGYAGTNVLLDDSIYLEWIEIQEEYRGNGYLREAIKSIMIFFEKTQISFQASEDNLSMYKHIGASITAYDDFTEMTSMELHMENLILTTVNV